MKLIYDKLLSSYAYNFNMRRYIKADRCTTFSAGAIPAKAFGACPADGGRGSHSSTSHLNLSRSCH